MGSILDSTVVIAAERAGVGGANTQKRQTLRQRFLDDLLSGMPVRPVTIPVGLRVALADPLIGATALE